MNYKISLAGGLLLTVAVFLGYLTVKTYILCILLLKTFYYYYYQMRYDLYVADSKIMNKILETSKLDSCVRISYLNSSSNLTFSFQMATYNLSESGSLGKNTP